MLTHDRQRDFRRSNTVLACVRTIYDKKADLMPTLDTLHQAVIEQVAAGKYAAGDWQTPTVGLKSTCKSKILNLGASNLKQRCINPVQKPISM